MKKNTAGYLKLHLFLIIRSLLVYVERPKCEDSFYIIKRYVSELWSTYDILSLHGSMMALTLEI